MDKKKLLTKLQKEQKDLGQRIMVLSNSLYFDDDLPAKDLVREQLQAMDKYFEALEARITDLQQDLDDEEEENQETAPKNFLDEIGNALSEHIDELIAMIHRDDKTDGYKELEGKHIISTDPCHCHECSLDGSGCKKLVLVGNKHICVK